MRLNTPFLTPDEIEAEMRAWRAQRVQRRHYPELERLIVAAASNATLARQLITAPEKVVHQVDHICCLSDDERAILCSITGAADIHEFAGRLYAALQQAHVAAAPASGLQLKDPWEAQLAAQPVAG